MIMYKLLKCKDQICAVLRLSDNTSIPFAPDNTDYQAYLKWLEAGNTPEAAE
jgi:hypothetical protein